MSLEYVAELLRTGHGPVVHLMFVEHQRRHKVENERGRRLLKLETHVPREPKAVQAHLSQQLPKRGTSETHCRLSANSCRSRCFKGSLWVLCSYKTACNAFGCRRLRQSKPITAAAPAVKVTPTTSVARSSVVNASVVRPSVSYASVVKLAQAALKMSSARTSKDKRGNFDIATQLLGRLDLSYVKL